MRNCIVTAWDLFNFSKRIDLLQIHNVYVTLYLMWCIEVFVLHWKHSHSQQLCPWPRNNNSPATWMQYTGVTTSLSTSATVAGKGKSDWPGHQNTLNQCVYTVFGSTTYTRGNVTIKSLTLCVLLCKKFRLWSFPLPFSFPFFFFLPRPFCTQKQFEMHFVHPGA